MLPVRAPPRVTHQATGGARPPLPGSARVHDVRPWSIAVQSGRGRPSLPARTIRPPHCCLWC
eukprot:4018607-Alexandrium_andersonii.AAC.1